MPVDETAATGRNDPEPATSTVTTEDAVPADRPASEDNAAKPAPSKVFPVVLGLALALTAGYQIGQYGHGHGPPTTTSTSPGAVAPDGHVHGSGSGSAAQPDVAGLSLSAGGYTLVPATTVFTAGQPADFRFRVVAPDGKTLTRFATVHDKQLHLIVVRRDFSGYQHLHPTLDAEGVWSTPLTLGAPGVWRAYADFSATGVGSGVTAFTLGLDLTVAGDYRPTPPAPPAREYIVDGLTVTMEGTARPGAAQPLLFRVYRDGAPVTDLERYLGAYGHLIALREGDLGYVHVHAEDQLSGGGAKFWLSAPSVGRYRLFFDFQVAGTVRTAAFTVEVR